MGWQNKALLIVPESMARALLISNIEDFQCIVDAWNRKFLVLKDVNKNHNSFFRDLGETPSKEDLSEDKFSRFSASFKLINKMYHGLKTQIEKPLLSQAPRIQQRRIRLAFVISKGNWVIVTLRFY